jgi:hypothetical protein
VHQVEQAPASLQPQIRGLNVVHLLGIAQDIVPWAELDKKVLDAWQVAAEL